MYVNAPNILLCYELPNIIERDIYRTKKQNKNKHERCESWRCYWTTDSIRKAIQRLASDNCT